MNIDMAALHAIEVDRGISVNELLETCLLYTSRCV